MLEFDFLSGHLQRLWRPCRLSDLLEWEKDRKKAKHKAKTDHSLWRRANAWSVKKKIFIDTKKKLWNSLRWQIFVINSVVSTLLFLVKHLLSTWDFTTGQDSGESRFSDEGADPNQNVTVRWMFVTSWCYSIHLIKSPALCISRPWVINPYLNGCLVTFSAYSLRS